jgi:sec-independent protein translocase protein TatC
VGLTFAYLAIPLLLKVLTRFGGGIIEPYFKASEYISFLIKMGLACGIIFEMPVVSWFLTRVGIITPKFLVSKLRHAVVIIFIVAAVITPPDVLSQFFLAVPLLVIYGISILVSYLSWERPK